MSRRVIREWETSEEKDAIKMIEKTLGDDKLSKAIKLIEKAMDVKQPDNQLAMPEACRVKISYISEALKYLDDIYDAIYFLEEDIKKLTEETKRYKQSSYNNITRKRSRSRNGGKRKTLKQ